MGFKNWSGLWVLEEVPLGLLNRCRLVRLIRDIEKLDAIEALEPTRFNTAHVLEKPRTLHLGSKLDLDRSRYA